MKSKTVVMDIDGVLCKPHTYLAIEEGVAVYDAMVRNHPIIFLTFREEERRKETLTWLKENVDRFVTNDQLYMRIPDTTPDEYPAPEQKVDILQALMAKDEVLMVFDDSALNVKAFRDAGYTAYQTQKNDY